MLSEREQKLLGRLPSASRRKVVKLSGNIDATHAANRQASERRRELREALQRDEEILGELSQRPNSDANRISMARENIALKKQELVDIDAASQERVSQNQSAHTILRNVLECLSSMPDGASPIGDKTAPASLRKGETYVAAVDRCRGRVAELVAERATVDAAPVPAALAKESATKKIEGLADAGRPGVSRIIDGGTDIQWPEKVARVMGGEVAGYTDGDDAVTLLCWLFKPQMIEAVCREIDNEADDANALAPADRAAALKRIAGEIEDIERAEASYIDQAGAAGVTISHRPDIGVRAFLAISDKFTTAPKADQAPRMTNGAQEPALRSNDQIGN